MYQQKLNYPAKGQDFSDVDPAIMSATNMTESAAS